MPNTLVRLKGKPDNGGEDQVVIKVQFKQKQFPVPIPNLKVNPSYFIEDDYDNWLQKNYTTKDGVPRSKAKINKKIKDFKTQIDTAFNNVVDAGFETISVKIIRNAIGKSPKEIKENKHVMMDSFFEEPLLKVYEKEFLIDPFVKEDEKNFKGLHHHLKNYAASLEQPILMKDLDSKFFSAFTNFLLGWQMKKGRTDDFTTYLTHDSVFKQIKKLRRFMKFCKEEKLKEMPEIEYAFPYRGTLNQVNPQCLHPIELDQIFHTEFPKPQLNNAKKLFFLAYSVGGQRISDVKQIVEEQLYKQDNLELFQKKTGKKIYSTFLESYFTEFKNDNLILHTSKHINDCLKEIIQYFVDKKKNDPEYSNWLNENGYPDAFSRNVYYKSYRGKSGKTRPEVKIPLAKDFTLGYARSTFITTLIFTYKRTREEVMLYTGHSSERIIDFYLYKQAVYERYQKDNKLIKPNTAFDFGTFMKMHDPNFLEELGIDIPETEEEMILEGLNAKGLSPEDLDSGDEVNED